MVILASPRVSRFRLFSPITEKKVSAFLRVGSVCTQFDVAKKHLKFQTRSRHSFFRYRWLVNCCAVLLSLDSLAIHETSKHHKQPFHSHQIAIANIQHDYFELFSGKSLSLSRIDAQLA